jgi:hypothetical protein
MYIRNITGCYDMLKLCDETIPWLMNLTKMEFFSHLESSVNIFSAIMVWTRKNSGNGSFSQNLGHLFIVDC